MRKFKVLALLFFGIITYQKEAFAFEDKKPVELSHFTCSPPEVSSGDNELIVTVGANSTISVTATGGSLTYQWQVSTDNGSTFTDLSNGTNYNNVNTTALSLIAIPNTFEDYQYRCIVTEDVCSSTSGVTTLSLSPSPLCASTSTMFGYEYVSSVTMNGVTFDGNSDFSGPGYYDYTANSIPAVTAGSSFPVSVDVETNSAFQQYVKIWIDFNKNGEPGDEVTELVFEQDHMIDGSHTFTGNISIPAGAFNGSLYARLIMQFSGTPNVCGEYDYGNTFDFRIPVENGVDPISLNVALNKSSGANGSVTSSPAGIDTDVSIYENKFTENDDVTLTATPTAGSRFLNWTGDISTSSNPLVITMNASKNVVANFSPLLLASLSSSSATDLTSISATLGGNITDDGGASVTERGVVINTSASPTTTDTKVTMGSGSGTFSQSATGLTAETTYYVRAYAINSVGTSYGNEISFTTPPLNTPPTAADFTANLNEGSVYAFATGDFTYSDGDSDPLHHVTIVTAPVSGTLFVDSNGNNSVDDDETLADAADVSKADLDAGRLKYLADGSTSSSFTFRVHDGTEASASAYTATLTVNAQPTVSINSTSPDPTNGSPIPVTITFSEAVTGFTVDDLSLSNASTSNFSGSDASYTVDLTPAAEGEITLDIAAGVASDAGSAGNKAASQFSITYDATTAAATFTAPASDGFVSTGTSDITFDLPEAPLAGSVKLTIARTGGADDPNAPHMLTLDQTTSGNYTNTYNPTDLSNDALISAVSSDPDDFLVDGAIYSFTLSYQDALGNAAATATHTNIIYDVTAPTVSSVSVPTDGTYVAGDHLDFTVNWSESVTVTGIPQLAITIGGTSVQADYLSGSGSNATTFRYMVQSGDQDTDGITIGTLDFNGGDIADRVFHADLTVNNAAATSGIYVDAIVPVVSSVDVPADKIHVEGENLDFTINWSEIVNITDTPEISVTIGSKEVKAVYVSGSGTAATTFSYSVEVGEKDLDGISLGTLALSGGTILDAAGNVADLNLNSVSNTGLVWVNSVIPEVTLSLDVLSLDENGGTAKLIVTLSESAGKDVTVELDYSGTAEGLTDYGVEAGDQGGGIMPVAMDLATTAVIEVGYTSREMLIQLLDESLDEADETVVVDIISVTNGTEASEQQVTLTILDDDHTPVITANQSETFAENLTADNNILTVAATDADASTVLQNWQILSGNPDEDGDNESAFSIDADTGEITVNDPDELDREIAESFVLEVSVSDGTNTSETETISFSLTDVNDINPYINAGQSFEVVEDSQNGFILGSVSATDEDVTPTTFQQWQIISGNPDNDQDSQPAFALDASTGELSVLDADELDGNTAEYTLTVSMSDGINTSAAATVNISLLQVNDAPSFTAGQDISINEDAGTLNFAAWATNISAGPDNESNQLLTFVLSTTDDAFFADLPTIDEGGKLSFTPADNVNGSVNVTVYLQDDGGSANGGVDKSETINFTISVTAVNDVPSFVKGEDISLQAGAADYRYEGWASLISAGQANEATQQLSFVASNDQPDFFTSQPAISDSGELSFSLADNVSGTVTVTVQLKDDGGTANGGEDSAEPETFTITVGKIAQVITFTPLQDMKVGQDPILLQASGGDSGQPVTFSISTEPARGVARLEGNQLIIENVGEVTVTATQAGNDTYQQAKAMLRRFNISANKLFLPSLFTPNEDGNNDRFIVRGGGGIATVDFVIFDRNNNIVFRSSSWEEITGQGWDGTHQGKKQPMGSYVWVIKGTFTNGQPLSLNGSQTGIIRLLR